MPNYCSSLLGGMKVDKGGEDGEKFQKNRSQVVKGILKDHQPWNENRNNDRRQDRRPRERKLRTPDSL